jgi:divalent metal cation (Fe/Co/Zn/Cd) transporter
LNREKYKNRIIKSGTKAAIKKKKQLGDGFNKENLSDLKIQTMSPFLRFMFALIGVVLISLAIIYLDDISGWLIAILILTGFIMVLIGIVGNRKTIESASNNLSGSGMDIELGEIIFDLISEIFDS